MDGFDEADRIFTEANAAIADFVLTEIDAGLMCCRIANIEQNDQERTRTMRRARSAYRTAQNALGKLKVTKAEFDRIAAGLRILEDKLRV